MAVELAPDIRVNAIAPGMIPTRLFFEAADVEGLQLDGLAARVPLGLGTPADVAAAAVYLASPASAYVAGANLLVHGGDDRPAYPAAVTDG